MNPCNDLPLEIIRGDDFLFDFEARDNDDIPIDLTTAAITASIADAPGGTVIDDFTVAIVSPLDGAVRLSLTAVETLALAERRAWWEMKMDDGGLIATLAAGRVVIRTPIIA